MDIAINEAKKAKIDVPVGAVIVKNNEIIAIAHNEKELKKANRSKQCFDNSPMRFRILSTHAGLKYRCKCKCGKIHQSHQGQFLYSRS